VCGRSSALVDDIAILSGVRPGVLDATRSALAERLGGYSERWAVVHLDALGLSGPVCVTNLGDAAD
jgi:hypothetical protein